MRSLRDRAHRKRVAVAHSDHLAGDGLLLRAGRQEQSRQEQEGFDCSIAIPQRCVFRLPQASEAPTLPRT